jgi:hypothetical protein
VLAQQGGKRYNERTRTFGLWRRRKPKTDSESTQHGRLRDSGQKRWSNGLGADLLLMAPARFVASLDKRRSGRFLSPSTDPHAFGEFRAECRIVSRHHGAFFLEAALS